MSSTSFDTRRRSGGLRRKPYITRKFASLTILATICLASGATGRAEAGQVIVNPGFETGGLAPWVASMGSPTVTSAEAHSGRYSVAAFGQDAIRQDFAPIAVADVTEVSFWAKRSGGPFNSVTFYYSDSTEFEFVVEGISND